MTARSPQVAARLAIDELASAGASFTYRPSDSVLPASFVYALANDGDRRRCRAIIAGAKADPIVWAALIAEIAERTGGANG